MWYSRQMIDLFLDPENEGQINNPDGIGQAENLTSGDFLKIYLKVGEKELLSDVKFEIFGCCEAVACSSMVTILAKGKSIQQAASIGEKEVIEALEGIPEDKKYCAALAVQALKGALTDIESRRKTGV